MKKYPISLTDSQWNKVSLILRDFRKRKYNLRDIFDGLFYLLKTGCQWRMIPSNFPPWESIYYYYSKWKSDGVIDMIHELLKEEVRRKEMKLQVWELLIVNLLKQLEVDLLELELMVERKQKAGNDI